MKSAKTNLPFESLDDDTYINYIEQADVLHEKGFHTDKSVIQLAKLLYEKDKQNED